MKMKMYVYCGRCQGWHQVDSLDEAREMEELGCCLDHRTATTMPPVHPVVWNVREGRPASLDEIENHLHLRRWGYKVLEGRVI